MIKKDFKKLDLLLELKEAISFSSDLSKILQTGLNKILMSSGMNAGAVYLLDKSGKLVMHASCSLPHELMQKLEKMVIGEGITGSVALSGKLEFVPDLMRDDRLARKIVKKYKLRTMVSIPLIGNNEVLGVMNVVSYRKLDFNNQWLDFFRKAGEFIGNGIYNIIIYQRVQHQVERMRDLNDINLEITMILNPINLLEKIPEYVNRLFRVDEYAIVLNRNIKLISKLRKVKDIRSPGFRHVRLGFNRRSLGKVIFEGDHDGVIVVNDYFNDKRFPVPLKHTFKSPRSVLGCRLIFGRMNLGIMVIGSQRQGAFNEEDKHIFKLFSANVAGSFGNALLFNDLRGSYRRLRAAQKVIVKGEKIATLIRLTTQIAHRIKNSLGAMRTSLDVLAKEVGLSRDAIELLDVLSMENRKLHKLVDDFFEFAGPERKEFQHVNLSEFLDGIISAFLEEISPKKIEIIKNYSDGNDRIEINPASFASLIRRLLENSADSVLDSNGRIEVGYNFYEKNKKGNRFVEIFVKDNGCGIEPAIIQKVTEPFFTTKPGSTGLGLAIVERIAEQHGGNVMIESVVNKGTCVKVILPAR